VPGSLVATTGVLGPGNVDFGIDCYSFAGHLEFIAVQLSALAISPD
jgi:hypothetical protein